MYYKGPFFEEGELGESDEEEFDSEGNNEKDYGKEQYDDLRIMWHQLMGKILWGASL